MLDPIPTSLLVDSLDVILPTLVKIINSSLQHSDVPTTMKAAVVTPLIKKVSLNPDEMKNYRLVSNLTYVSKLLERVVARQLNNHINLSNLSETYQSAYKSRHSTETALVRVQNDILCALDAMKMCSTRASRP